MTLLPLPRTVLLHLPLVRIPPWALSCYGDRCFCDCADCSANCRLVCKCYRPALWWVACARSVCGASDGSTTISSCCMDRSESLPVHRQRHLGDSHHHRCCHGSHCRRCCRVASCCWTLSGSSDDLTTSNKQTRKLAHNCLYSCASLFCVNVCVFGCGGCWFLIISNNFNIQ